MTAKNPRKEAGQTGDNRKSKTNKGLVSTKKENSELGIKKWAKKGGIAMAGLKGRKKKHEIGLHKKTSKAGLQWTTERRPTPGKNLAIGITQPGRVP